MPTYNWHPRFMAEFKALAQQDADAFLRARDRFVAALKAGRPPDPGLGIQQMTGHPGIYEFHFSRRVRATFHYGSAVRGPDAHVVWRRIGGHEIYTNP